MLQRDQERGDQNNFAVAAFQTRKQVSISSVLLTNEILVMRKIVENLSQRPNMIDLCNYNGSGLSGLGRNSQLEDSQTEET
ncbi:hypothetical protein ACFX11_035708 [Malus domestica]